MRRRDLLSSAAALLSWPLISSAQKRSQIYRVVIVGATPRQAAQHLYLAFEQGMREHGYAPGKDVLVEFRSSEGRADRYPELVQEVVRSKPDVIVTGINANASPIKAATQTIPIVFAIGTDVVAAGFAQSLARPGGNMTGLTWDVGAETVAKRMELLKEIAPKISRVAVLSEEPYGIQYRIPTEEAAKALRLRTSWLEFSGDLERDFADIARGNADALYVHHGLRLFAKRNELAAMAAKHRLPTACGSAEVVDAGALMSYGPSLTELFRRAASYVDKILKGAKPGDLPVERPAKLELVVNRRTVKTLGLTLSQSLLLRVDRLVE